MVNKFKKHISNYYQFQNRQVVELKLQHQQLFLFCLNDFVAHCKITRTIIYYKLASTQRNGIKLQQTKNIFKEKTIQDKKTFRQFYLYARWDKEETSPGESLAGYFSPSGIHPTSIHTVFKQFTEWGPWYLGHVVGKST